jgi:hypothetical protein
VLLLRLGGLVLRVVVAHDVRVWFDVKSEMERHKTRNWRLVHSGDTRYIITFWLPVWVWGMSHSEKSLVPFGPLDDLSAPRSPVHTPN